MTKTEYVIMWPFAPMNWPPTTPGWLGSIDAYYKFNDYGDKGYTNHLSEADKFASFEDALSKYRHLVKLGVWSYMLGATIVKAVTVYSISVESL